jgi:hypothetical protein
MATEKIGWIVVCSWKDGQLLRYSWPFEFRGSFLHLDKRDFEMMRLMASQAGQQTKQMGRRVEAVRVMRNDDPLKEGKGEWTDPDLAGAAWLAVMDGYIQEEERAAHHV